jgi:hypothetical protein
MKNKQRREPGRNTSIEKMKNASLTGKRIEMKRDEMRKSRYRSIFFRHEERNGKIIDVPMIQEVHRMPFIDSV